VSVGGQIAFGVGCRCGVVEPVVSVDNGWLLRADGGQVCLQDVAQVIDIISGIAIERVFARGYDTGLVINIELGRSAMLVGGRIDGLFQAAELVVLFLREVAAGILDEPEIAGLVVPVEYFCYLALCIGRSPSVMDAIEVVISRVISRDDGMVISIGI